MLQFLCGYISVTSLLIYREVKSLQIYFGYSSFSLLFFQAANVLKIANV